MIPFLSKVKRLSILKKSSTFIRFLHDDKKAVYPLNNRSLVKVSGPDAAPFLQGLITNDMNHFEDGAQSMYAMFLNEKGRVLYDTLVHKWTGDNNTQFLLECDKSIQHVLERYLKIYQLKRKIKIEDVGDKFKLWALVTFDKYDNVCESDGDYNISIFKDPRLAELGYRLITSTNMGVIGIHQAIGMDTVIRSDDEGYQALRYRLGVSEGAKDLAPGVCFPLEANCDYLHGVSFHKGCYIGQELTARVYHTGVIRKRIMPIQILGIKKADDLQADAPILSGTTTLGKFKGHVGTCGLGLVRIKEALQAKIVNIGMNSIEIFKPHWWPVEAAKEYMPVRKSESEARDL